MKLFLMISYYKFNLLNILIYIKFFTIFFNILRIFIRELVNYKLQCTFVPLVVN
jgi:hypothetical protein